MNEDSPRAALHTEHTRRFRMESAIPLIRLAVGLIFFSQGVLKFTDPNMGVNRFTRIGFPHPGFTAHFVGAFEIVCGALVLIGFLTRVAAIPLLFVICTAIATTKIPELSRANQGFWFMVSDARTDFSMLCSLLFLIIAGGGAWAIDRRFSFHRANVRGSQS
ncbi:MAG: DoxX family protein [Terriglobales bacterium]